MEGGGGALRLALAAGRRLFLLLDCIDPAGPPRAEIGRRISGRQEKRKERKAKSGLLKEREARKKSRRSPLSCDLFFPFLLLRLFVFRVFLLPRQQTKQRLSPARRKRRFLNCCPSLLLLLEKQRERRRENELCLSFFRSFLVGQRRRKKRKEKKRLRKRKMAFRPHHQARRASRARLALSLTALLWARYVAPPAVRAQVLVSGPAATPVPVSAAAAAAAASTTAATTTTTTTLELPSDPTATPPPSETTPAATDPPQPPSETTTPPSESQDAPVVPPSTAPPEALSPAAEPGQTRLRAQFRVSGVGGAASAADSQETRSAFLDAVAAGSSNPSLPRSSLSVLRVTPAYVPLPSDSNNNKKRKASRRQLLLFEPIGDTSDILVEVDASSLNAGASTSANAQAAYTSVRNAAYSGLIQKSLRATGRRWAVVLTYAAPAAPGSELLPLPDDACEHRFSRSSCLDGTGLTPAAAKGIIALGVLVVLFALAFAGVAWDRRARAVGFGGGGSGSGSGGSGTVKTGTMADLAGSPRAAASAAGLTAIPLPPQVNATMEGRSAAAPGAALAIGEASSSSSSGVVAGAISSGKIKAER